MGALIVVKGQIPVGEQDVVLDRTYCRVWNLELFSKAVQVVTAHPKGVWLRSTEPDGPHGTLTVVQLDLRDDWDVIAEAARYNLRIVAYRTPRVSDIYNRRLIS